MMMAEWAVTSSILILILLAVRFLFREKLSARLRYVLWAVVLVRLLLPFQIKLPAAVSQPLPLLASNLVEPLEERLVTEDERQGRVYEALIPSELVTWEDIPKGDDVYLSVFLPYDHAPLPDHMTVDEADVIYRTGIGAPVTLDDKVMSPWLIGLALSGGAMLWSNLLFSRKLKKRRKALEDVEAPIPVYVAEGLPSPCLFGLFRPAVYVTPGAEEDPDALRHVLAHELTHYAHKDHLWSLLRCLALALHWYNPLVWLAVALSKRDGELACDEGAVARLGEEERIPYGRTLVDMVAQRSLRPADLLSCSTAMTGGGKSIQQRVAQLVKHPKTVKTALFAAVAVVVLAVVFVFAGRGEEEGITSSPEFDVFLAQVEAAQQINIGNPIISSTITPGEISDPEFLAQAKELLREGRGVFDLGDDIQWEDIRSSLSSTAEQPVGIPPEELEKMFFERGCPLILFPTADRDWENACRYWLVPWEGYCLLVDWDAEREENSIDVLGSWPFDLCGQLKELARQEAERSWDPSLPRAMTDAELNRYTPEFLQGIGVTQLWGQPDSLESVTFHAGYTSPDVVELWYRGDATHGGVWVLVLSQEDNTLLADQPMEVFNAAQTAGEEVSFEQLGPGAFAASLRPVDVVSVTAGNYFPGQTVTVDVQELKDQLVRALYHQCSAGYDEEKYGQYTLTICVEKDVGYYLHDGGTDGLILSVGSEPDIVCVRHRILASPNGPMIQYVYSPELYRTIRNIFD